MSKRTWILLGSTIVALTISSCGQPRGNIDLDGTNWVLVDMAGAGPIPGSALTIGFDEGQVHGHLGCNSFSGPYTFSGITMEFGLLMSTLMACVDNDMMAQESRMFELIGQVEQAQLIDGRLHLGLGDGNQLIYEPVN
jgi:heat shock protein HslJ